MPVAEHPVGKRRRGGQRPIDGRFVDDHCRATERRRRRLTSSEMPLRVILADVKDVIRSRNSECHDVAVRSPVDATAAFISRRQSDDFDDAPRAEIALTRKRTRGDGAVT
jgi:hypothetical protein